MYFFQCLTVNGSLLSNKHWQEVGLTGFVMTEITVTQPGFHRIESEADYQASFGGYVYGEGATDVAYAAPLTMEGNKTVEVGDNKLLLSSGSQSFYIAASLKPMTKCAPPPAKSHTQ